MDNAFFKFVEAYWEDIKALFASLINFFTTIIGKMSEPEEPTE